MTSKASGRDSGFRRRNRSLAISAAVIGTLALIVGGVGAFRALDSGSSGCGAFAAAYNSKTSASTPVGDIYLFDGQLNACRRLTHDGQSIEPSISPDGRRIAFISGRGHEFDADYGLNDFQSAYVMAIDGSAQQRLSAASVEGPIAWSPDGRRVAFVSGRASAAVSIINVDTGSRTQMPLAPHCTIVQWIDEGHLALQCNLVPQGYSIESADVRSAERRTVMTLPPGTSFLSMRYVAVLPAHSRAKRLLIRDLRTQRTHLVRGTEVPQDVASFSSVLFTTSDGHIFWQRHEYLGSYDLYMSDLAGGPARLIRRQRGQPFSPLSDNPARQP